ncbi:hypothetical protein [Actinoplanes sp. NPDC051859]|uniref:hypothetical protein n=1 Tax=Actinoplanes sp. NPDC051859 TaxID=3363909 RepID=UPI00379D785A
MPIDVLVLSESRDRSPAQRGLPPGAAVWVERGEGRRPAIVLLANARAATVRYRPTAGRGTVVDTVLTERISVRREADMVDDATGSIRDVRRAS